MYAYINTTEHRMIRPTPGSSYAFEMAMHKFRQFKQWAIELDRPHEEPKVATLINVAFFAGEFNRMITPMIVDDLTAEIEEVNEVLNRYADKFSPKQEETA